jgi:hypothetical protein
MLALKNRNKVGLALFFLFEGGAVVPGRTVTTTNGQSLNVTTFYSGPLPQLN